MNLQEYENFYHVDISTQIDNKWKTDTVLGIVKDPKRYSIKIKAKDKLKIRKRFITKDTSKSEKRHNKKIVMITYSYLLYKALCEFNEANPLLLCRDVRPERLVIHYFQRVSNFFGNKDILNKKIKFRKRAEFETENKLPKSLAGKYVRKVYQKKIKPNKILNGSEVEELLDIIGKII